MSMYEQGKREAERRGKRDGGPAYLNGMTLRDYFAAKAMIGLMGRSWDHADPNEIFSIWAKSAYMMADAMLKERAQQ